MIAIIDLSYLRITRRKRINQYYLENLSNIEHDSVRILTKLRCAHSNNSIQIENKSDEETRHLKGNILISFLILFLHSFLTVNSLLMHHRNYE